MKQLKQILKERDDQIQLLKHKANCEINDLWNKLDKCKIHYEIGWITINVSLVKNLITFTLENIHENNSYQLIAAVNITTVLSNNFTKEDIQITRFQTSDIVLDPNIWKEMKQRIFNVIEEIIGFN